MVTRWMPGELGTGVGADGVVFLESVSGGDVRMRYYNSDGTEAALCGLSGVI